MKKTYFILMFIIFLGGCTRYSKVVQLTPQKTGGWKLSHELSINECNDVEVWVRPVIMSYEGGGLDVLFLPIQTYNKESLKEANDFNPSVEVTFRHWYRDEHIESCSLSFVELEDKDSSQRIHPISVQKFTGGEHVIKYSTICTYSFDPDDIAGNEFDLHINNTALGCQFEPIPSVYEKKTHHTIYELM